MFNFFSRAVTNNPAAAGAVAAPMGGTVGVAGAPVGVGGAPVATVGAAFPFRSVGAIPYNAIPYNG